MTLAEVVLAVMWVGVTLYSVFAGADFGAGFWDLLAGDARTGAADRKLIEQRIGPVWEANHVWLIFVLVVLWSGFPVAFAAIMSTLYIPLTIAAIGIILRGSAFVFRKAVDDGELQRAFGAAFAASSVLTPFFLGVTAGAVASGRVAVNPKHLDPIGVWLHPTSILGGTLAVATCAYLAAVFLAADADRLGQPQLAARFRRHAFRAAIVAGVISLGGIAVLYADARHLFEGLTGRGLPLIAIAAGTGLWSITSLVKRKYSIARVAAVGAVVAVVWGWAAAQYPDLLADRLTIEAGAGHRTTLMAMLISLAIGAVLAGPPLVALLVLHARGRFQAPTSPGLPPT